MLDRQRMLPYVLSGALLVTSVCFANERKAADPERPIRTDLREAVALGVSGLTNSFDRDNNDEPYWDAYHRKDGTGQLRHDFDHVGKVTVPHAVGRCLWATMLAEETVGVPFPPEALEILTRYCRTCYDNKDHLNSYLDPRRGNERNLEFHSMREGLFGLVALMRGRNSQWARETADGMLLTIEKITSPEGHFSVELIARNMEIVPTYESILDLRTNGRLVDATTNGRLVDPLLEYYKFTKNPLALKLAGMYARATLESSYTPEGKFGPRKASGGHIHSITSSLAGITSYAAFTNNHEMLEKCRRIVDKGVPEYFSSWGWGDEFMPDDPYNVQSRGEVNQTGDVIRTALLLGQYVSAKYYELAERYTRSMLLPAQLREENLKEFLRENIHPRGDFERDVLKRTIGTYGFPLPNDRLREGDWAISTLDITSGAVHALCEVWRHRVTSDQQSIKVNLPFDYEGSDLKVVSQLPKEGRLEFSALTSKNLLVRIPGWVDRKTLKLSVKGRPQLFSWSNGYMKVTDVHPGWKATLTFAVPHKQETEIVDGIKYQTKWVGNQIIEILPRGRVSPLPF